MWRGSPNWLMHWLKIKSFVSSSGALLLIVLNDWTLSSRTLLPLWSIQCRRLHTQFLRTLLCIWQEHLTILYLLLPKDSKACSSNIAKPNLNAGGPTKVSPNVLGSQATTYTIASVYRPIFPSLNWTLSIHHIPQKGTLSSSDLIPASLHPRNAIRAAVTCTSIVNSTKPCCNIPLMQTRKSSSSTRQPKSRSSSSYAILPKTTSTSSNLGLSTSSMTPSIVVATMFSATILVRWLGLESALDSAVGRYLAGYAISKRQRRRPLV